MEIKAISALSCEEKDLEQNCKTSEELNKFWGNAHFTIKFINQYFDTYNKDDP